MKRYVHSGGNLNQTGLKQKERRREPRGLPGGGHSQAEVRGTARTWRERQKGISGLGKRGFGGILSFKADGERG